MGWGDAFAYQSPADIFASTPRLSAFENDGSRAFDIGALDRRRDYDALPPTQWPATRLQPTAPPGCSPTAASPRRTAAPASSPVRAAGPGDRRQRRIPLLLNTGRIRDQWHTMTRTGLVPRLSSHIAEPFVAINPADAAALNLTDDDLAVLRSRQGDGHAARPQSRRTSPKASFSRRCTGTAGSPATAASTR